MIDLDITPLNLNPFVLEKAQRLLAGQKDALSLWFLERQLRECRLMGGLDRKVVALAAEAGARQAQAQYTRRAENWERCAEILQRLLAHAKEIGAK